MDIQESRRPARALPKVPSGRRRARGPGQGSRDSHRLSHRRKPQQAKGDARAPQQACAGYEISLRKHAARATVTRTTSPERRDEPISCRPCRGLVEQRADYFVLHVANLSAVARAGIYPALDVGPEGFQIAQWAVG